MTDKYNSTRLIKLILMKILFCTYYIIIMMHYCIFKKYTTNAHPNHVKVVSFKVRYIKCKSYIYWARTNTCVLEKMHCEVNITNNEVKRSIMHSTTYHATGGQSKMLAEGFQKRSIDNYSQFQLNCRRHAPRTHRSGSRRDLLCWRL